MQDWGPNWKEKSTTCALGSLSEQEKAAKSQSCDQNGATLWWQMWLNVGMTERTTMITDIKMMDILHLM